jgi:selenocysteine lyase/cysteine desulfurase
VDAFRRQITGATKLIAFTHVTARVGDLLPARELCQLARERGALSLVDGAQSFGVLDVDLSRMQPDFYTGSAHKWPCGSKETGLLFVSARVHDRIKPTIVSLYGGTWGFRGRWKRSASVTRRRSWASARRWIFNGWSGWRRSRSGPATWRRCSSRGCGGSTA